MPGIDGKLGLLSGPRPATTKRETIVLPSFSCVCHVAEFSSQRMSTISVPNRMNLRTSNLSVTKRRYSQISCCCGYERVHFGLRAKLNE